MTNKEKTGELKRLNARVRPEMYDFLKESAEARGLTMNAMIIFALETYFQQQAMLPYIGDLIKESQKLNE